MAIEASAYNRFPADGKILVIGHDADTSTRSKYRNRVEFWSASQVMRPEDIPSDIVAVSVFAHLDDSERKRVMFAAEERGIRKIVRDSSLSQLRSTLGSMLYGIDLDEPVREVTDKGQNGSKKDHTGSGAEPTGNRNNASTSPVQDLRSFVKANFNTNCAVLADEYKRIKALYKQRTGRDVSVGTVGTYVSDLKRLAREEDTTPAPTPTPTPPTPEPSGAAQPAAPKEVSATASVPIMKLVRDLQLMLDRNRQAEAAQLVSIFVGVEELSKTVSQLEGENATLRVSLDQLTNAKTELDVLRSELERLSRL